MSQIKIDPSYVQQNLNTNDKAVVITFYLGLYISTLLCIFLTVMTKKKIKIIKNKESYSRTSVWTLYLTGINLVI
jgi:hypothetical protein